MIEQLLDLQAKVLEYEHALEHVAECHLGGCPDCVKIAQSALRRDNREDFFDLALDAALAEQSLTAVPLTDDDEPDDIAISPNPLTGYNPLEEPL